MTSPALSKSYNEFERESHRVDELVWAAMAIAPASHVLFLGFENSRAAIERALRDNVSVTVVDSNPHAIREAQMLGIEVVRASTSGMPFRAESFDVVVAFHYLHEADPSFHPQIVAEMARVARRIAVVEPGPPGDLLGSRIASLYARAKRDRGQFEQYQQIDYWRRLLGSARPVVVPLSIAYGSLPPRAFLRDTMRMMLDLMRIGGVAPEDLNEMRALANASDTQMLPQPRYVLLAAANTALIPARPRVRELEELSPLHARDRRKPKASYGHESREDLNRGIQPRGVRPPAQSNPQVEPVLAPPVVESILPHATLAITPPLAPLPSNISFEVPAIKPLDTPIEELFSHPNAGHAPRGFGSEQTWNADQTAEMPDFGLPNR